MRQHHIENAEVIYALAKCLNCHFPVIDKINLEIINLQVRFQY